MRRWLLVGAVVGAALIVARTLPLRPDLFSSEIAGAREITAYELAVGAPLTFALPPGTRALEVLSNLDVRGAEPVPYALHVRDPQDGRDEVYPMVAEPPGPAAFFLRRSEIPGRTRRLSLMRAGAAPGPLEVSLDAPGGSRASLRVLVAHDRLAASPAAVVVRAPLSLDDLAPEARATLEGQSWGRLSTTTKSPTRSFYVRGDLAPPPRPGREGQTLVAGQVAAYTVRGPGTLDVEAGQGRVSVLDETGLQRDLAVQGRLSLAIVPGLVTVRVSVVGPVLVTAGSAAMLLEPGDTTLSPNWSWHSLVRVQEPVTYAAGRRGDAALRVVARVPGGDAHLSWRFLDGAGGTVGRGSNTVVAPAAPEDRADGGPVSEPVALYLWPPRAAQRLVFRADRPVLLEVASPGFTSELPPEHGPTVLRHARPERPAFYPVRPLDEAALRTAGRLVRFAGAVRLEPRPAPATLAAPSSLVPRGAGGRFVLVAPLPPEHPGRGAGLLWTVRAGHDEALTVPRPRGASRRAHVGATLLYETTRRRPLIVTLDGKLVRRAVPTGTRGQLTLPALPVGQHRLRIEGQGRFFVDQPVAGATAFRQSRVFALRGGQVVIPVTKGAAARSLGLVLYSDGPAPRAELTAVVDGGRRRLHAGSSRVYTRLRRALPLAFRRSPGATYLNRSGAEIWASAPVFVPLGDDLPRGVHQVRIRISGAGKQPVARFFSYGGPAASRINQHVELRAEMSE